MRRFLFTLLFLSTSCGYQWGNRNERLPGRYTEVAVPVFKNRTQEVGSEAYFTNAIIEEIVRSPVNSITSQDKAEVVLEGEILRIDTRGEGESNAALPLGVGLISTYKLYVEVDLRIRKKADQSVIWSQKFVGERPYTSAQIAKPMHNSANPIYNQSALHENLKLVAKDLMNKAYNLMTESF